MIETEMARKHFFWPGFELRRRRSSESESELRRADRRGEKLHPPQRLGLDDLGRQRRSPPRALARRLRRAVPGARLRAPCCAQARGGRLAGRGPAGKHSQPRFCGARGRAGEAPGRRRGHPLHRRHRLASDWRVAVFCLFLLSSAFFCFLLLSSAFFLSSSAFFCFLLPSSAFFCLFLPSSAFFCFLLPWLLLL